MKFKYNLHLGEFQEATIGRKRVETKQTRRNQSNTDTIILNNLYDRVLPIAAKKKKGLVKLCTSNPPSIPAPFHEFFLSLPSSDNHVVADDDFNDSDYDDL